MTRNNIRYKQINEAKKMKQIEIEYHLDRHIIKIDGHEYDSRVMTLEEAKKLAEATK